MRLQEEVAQLDRILVILLIRCTPYTVVFFRTRVYINFRAETKNFEKIHIARTYAHASSIESLRDAESYGGLRYVVRSIYSFNFTAKIVDHFF